MTDRNLLVSLPRVRWTAHAEPIHLSLAQLMYQLRRHDAHEGLLLDALNLADIEASVEQWLALDALTSPYAQLERKMQILQRTLSRVSPTLKPVALQLSAPFRQHGSTQVTVIFELSDGQTITIYFHNPDTTPHKLNPNDELVSWKWLLNKKDITIVVAPEKGQDLNLLEVATRVIKLAEKNSPAFTRANAKRAAKAEEINQLKIEIAALEKELAGLQNELELLKHQRNEAQQEAEKRKQNNENNPDTLADVAIPAGLTESEMAVLAASIYRKPYMRTGEAREMLSPKDMEHYPHIQQKLTHAGYITKSGATSKKGIKLLEEFAEQLGAEGALYPWIEAQKQKQQAALKLKSEEKTPEPLSEKLTEIADILDKTYGYGTNEDEDEHNERIIRLSLPESFEYHDNGSNIEWIIQPNSEATAILLSFDQAAIFTIDDLQTLSAAQLAKTIHNIITRFQGKTDGYIHAIQYLEQGATQAGLHVHYGDFNHSISGSLFDTASGNDPIIGITAQLHANNKVWARARISESGELDILSGSAGDTVIGRAENAQEVTHLLQGLMNEAKNKSTLANNEIDKSVKKQPWWTKESYSAFYLIGKSRGKDYVALKERSAGLYETSLVRSSALLTMQGGVQEIILWLRYYLTDMGEALSGKTLSDADVLAKLKHVYGQDILKQTTQTVENKEFAAPQNPYSDYLHEANGDSFEAAKTFYKNELQGKIVKTVIGDVWMLRSGWQKMKVGMKSDQIKANLLPYVPDILKYGKYEGREDSYKERKDDYVAFHFFTKAISLEQKEFTVAVSVSESSNKQFEYRAYGLKHSEDAAWKKKMAPSAGGGKPPLDAISYRTTDAIGGIKKIQHQFLDKVNPELEIGWNIRILKVVDLATNQRIYNLEDADDDITIVQQTVINKAEITPSNPVIASDKPETAALYAFDETRTQAQRNLPGSR